MLDINTHIFEQPDELKAVIAYRIKNCGMTLQQLERQSKLSMPTLRKLANGKIVPRLLTIAKLSEGMGLDLKQFLFE